MQTRARKGLAIGLIVLSQIGIAFHLTENSPAGQDKQNLASGSESDLAPSDEMSSNHRALAARTWKSLHTSAYRMAWAAGDEGVLVDFTGFDTEGDSLRLHFADAGDPFTVTAQPLGSQEARLHLDGEVPVAVQAIDGLMIDTQEQDNRQIIGMATVQPSEGTAALSEIVFDHFWAGGLGIEPGDRCEIQVSDGEKVVASRRITLEVPAFEAARDGQVHADMAVPYQVGLIAHVECAPWAGEGYLPVGEIDFTNKRPIGGTALYGVNTAWVLANVAWRGEPLLGAWKCRAVVTDSSDGIVGEGLGVLYSRDETTPEDRLTVIPVRLRQTYDSSDAASVSCSYTNVELDPEFGN